MSELQSDNCSLKEVFRKAGFTGKIALALSTWFGTGLLPVAPGTFGTLATVPIAIGVNSLEIWQGLIVLMTITCAAIWSSNMSRQLLGRNDPPEVVIDEVAGFLVTMFFLPSSWLILCSGFILFRFFDIIKPYPIKKIEKLKGGYGIVLDDILAGVYAHLGVRIILFL